MTWGDTDTGGSIDPVLAVYSATRIVATRGHMAALSPKGWLLVWGGATSGWYSLDHEVPTFRLAGPVMGLIRAPDGLVAVLGNTCTMTEWSSWSNCTRSCGGGSQTRTRQIATQPLNTVCADPTEETQACNTHTCKPPASEDTGPTMSVGILVTVGGGGLLVLGLLGYGCVACIRQRRVTTTL